MKRKLIILPVLFSLLSSGCATTEKPKADKENTKTYITDLNSDGKKEIIETEDKFASDSLSLVSIKKKVKNKNKKLTTELLDSCSVPGKIKKLDFCDLNFDGQKQLVVYSEGEEGLYIITIYQLDSEYSKLAKVFEAASKYGINAKLDTIATIKIGKAPPSGRDSNSFSYWDTWVWTGDKFTKQ